MKSITYLGSADDVVYRYPWSAGGSDKDSLWHELTHAIIYDQRIALNDGYIVANPLLVALLERLDTSILGNALLLGNAFLFSRGKPQNLAEGLSKSAEKITTLRNIFEAKPELSGNLEILQKYVNKWSIPWPDKNMGEIFYSFLKTSLEQADYNNVSSDVVTKVWDKFDASLNTKFDTARQTWENVCWEVVAGIDLPKKYPDPLCDALKQEPQYDTIRTLMTFANSAYHNGYSSALAHSLIKTPNANLMDREICPLTSFDCPDISIYKKEEVAEFENLEERIKHLGTLLITVDRLKLKDANDFQWTQAFELRSGLKTLRTQYLDALNKYINSGHINDLLEAKLVTDDYRNEIAKLLAGRVRSGVEILEDAVKLIDPLCIAKSIRFIEKSFEYVGWKMPSNTIGIQPIKKFITHHSLLETLEAEGLKSNDQGNNLTLAKRFGLVNAPLDKIRLNEILKPIKSYEDTHK
jgi:hypothetical protein